MSHITRVEEMLEFMLANQEEFLTKMKAMREAQLAKTERGLPGKGASPKDGICCAAPISP
jgi:hypothetical protein